MGWKHGGEVVAGTWINGSDGELNAASAGTLGVSLHFILTPTIWLSRIDVFCGVRCPAGKPRKSCGIVESHADDSKDAARLWDEPQVKGNLS